MKQEKSSRILARIADAIEQRKHAEGDADSGFTLIELMVVLLIMAILLAIAIPAFLGVTNNAKKVATQTDLSNVLTSAKAVYTTTGSYGTGTTATFLAAIKAQTPSVTFKTAGSLGKATSGKPVIGLTVVSNTVVVLYGRDSQGGCWGISSNTTTAKVATFTSGVEYWWSTAKPGTPTPTCTKTTLITGSHTTSFNGTALKAQI